MQYAYVINTFIAQLTITYKTVIKFYFITVFMINRHYKSTGYDRDK